ncbi:hypothetical protein FRC15_000807 [Serendipita sp. 397]|nr:hypothetical protein FRC15_000807 [Serendipita sp. 397]
MRTEAVIACRSIDPCWYLQQDCNLTSTMSHTEQYLADLDPPYCSLNVGESFKQLTDKEKLYTHYVGLASWAGASIIQSQWTPEAQNLYKFLALTFSNDDGSCVDFSKLKKDAKSSDDDWNYATSYTAQVLGNLVNYKSFGFSKFIPRIKAPEFEAIVLASPNATTARPLWDQLKDYIYSVEPEAKMLIGDPNKGHVTNYYFGTECTTEKDVTTIQDQIQKLAEHHQIDVLNTRVEKHAEKKFTLHIASVDESEEDITFEMDGSQASLKIKFGDFKPELSKSIKALQKARDYAANVHQESAIDGYIKSFQTGDIQQHKDGSIHWVKDIGPVVESYIGFIETYVDPWGARAEWEGFTAIVNKELSSKYETLVHRASQLITCLPWGKDFEVDEFRKPDFTALEVVSFCTGGIPAGINIPLLRAPNEEVTFVHQDDLDLYNKWDSKAFELQVANHELLGHGSGKLFTQDSDGNLNFDKDKVRNPLTGEPITSWYLPGQTPGSVLGSVSSSMEECRAEAVALYLVSNREILSIFNYVDEEEIKDIQYITFLLMCRAGLRALEFYDPKAKKHLQAHMQGRMGITNHLIKNGIASVVKERDEQGSLINAYVKVNRDAVLNQGREVMGKLLVELQVLKATADAKGAKTFYTSLTDPMPEWDNELRQLVLLKKLPRKLFVQPNTLIEGPGPSSTGQGGEKVVLKEYELNAQGMIESYIDRRLI